MPMCSMQDSNGNFPSWCAIIRKFESIWESSLKARPVRVDAFLVGSAIKIQVVVAELMKQAVLNLTAGIAGGVMRLLLAYAGAGS